jgi:hypothetical protein
LSCVSFAVHPAWGARKAFNLYDIVADYLMLPRAGQLLLEPAWTFKQDALFYLILGAIIIDP